MATAVYVVECDWDNDGDFLDTNEDITEDVKEIRYSRGKDAELGKASPGTLNIRLNNANGKYSPSLSSGALYGNLLPKRAIRVRTTSPAAYDLFYGYIETITPHPDWTSQDCYISAIDGLDFLARHELDTILRKNNYTGFLVHRILDDANWPVLDGGHEIMPSGYKREIATTDFISSVGAQNLLKGINRAISLRKIDIGKDSVPYAHWHKVRAKTALEDITDSELGFIYINGAGELCYEDRHHRYTATHQTSQATFDDTMVSIAYDYSARNVYNEVRATVTPWELKALTTLWVLEEIPSLAVGETKTWWGDASVAGSPVFVDAWTTPVATTDYTANSKADGSGDDETANISIVTTKFAKSIKLAVTNNAAHPVYITKLQARGTYYDDQTKVSRKSEDSTSQTAYQKRTLTLDGKYLTDADKAQDFCDYGIARFKDPQAEISKTIINKDSTNLTQILAREISDRITVKNTKLGLDADFFINKMEHEITKGGKRHKCVWHLGAAENEDFWCLDYSELGVGSKLCY